MGVCGAHSSSQADTPERERERARERILISGSQRAAAEIAAE